jgi:hypothetical protein
MEGRRQYGTMDEIMSKNGKILTLFPKLLINNYHIPLKR